MALQVQNLSPAYFGMVMATGIVALAAYQVGLYWLAWGLTTIAILTYLVLWSLTFLRVYRHPRLFFGDMIDHLRGPGFFTMVAASGIVGSQFVVMAEAMSLGFAFWFLALFLWIILTYTIFTAFTVKEEKPTLDKGISGAWLLAVVATQSIAVLAALLAAHTPQPYRLDLNFRFCCKFLIWRRKNRFGYAVRRHQPERGIAQQAMGWDCRKICLVACAS
ncbi:MAG: tellurite resistance/C4-dicarboxylate transporter family protein, partial [Alphaproteobacteria bacterium]|nr:tellurite resistance/C4-dicarboxylate transporter family protein [Alphaproteobacteria bacterium]